MVRHHGFVVGASVAALLVASGCSRRQPPADASNEGAVRSISWPAMAGAERYVVRAWSGHQLLFEITTAETTLGLTPSMARAIAAFDSATAEITAQAASQVVGRVSRPLWPAPSPGGAGAGGGT